MSHYVIYIPAGRPGDPHQLADVGLGQLLRDDDSTPHVATIVQGGPDGGGGQFLHWHASQHYHPGRYDWWPAKPAKGLAAGRFWCGIDPESPPTPADLQRLEPLAGRVWRSPAGEHWTLPNVTRLPYRFDLDDSGDWSHVVCDQFHEVQQRCLWAFDVAREFLTAGKPLPERDALEFCVDILSLNYRVNRDICAHLKLFEGANLVNALVQTVDVVAIQQILGELEKNAPASIPAG